MEIKRPFSPFEWHALPEAVRVYISALEHNIVTLSDKIDPLEKRIEQLEARLNQNSKNSNKPPSSDGLFKRPEKKADKKKRKRGAQKGHKGYRQQLLKPNRVEKILPKQCSCGNCDFTGNRLKPYYTHQVIELPKIQMDVTHYMLQQGKCSRCGQTVKATLPNEFQSGFGPRFSALIAELSGTEGMSRQAVQRFCNSVLDVPISVGGIQKVLDRTSEAIKPIYELIGRIARTSGVNGIDETSWFENGKLKWLWTMVNKSVCFFLVHPNRSQKAFEALIEDWNGILISDDYGVYKNWINHRQLCLAHLIRRAKALSERKNEPVQRFGQQLASELKLLCRFAHAPPSQKQWTDFYSRLMLLLLLFEGADDDAGKLARRVSAELDSLWRFLDEPGVEPTNNAAERALRFGVLWRKRSYGTQSEKGNRWVERILSVRQTCRQRSQSTFPILVNAISSYFKCQKPNFDWLT
jgi:transposase